MEGLSTGMRVTGAVAAGVGSLAGAIGAFLLLRRVHEAAEPLWLQLLVLLLAWFAVSLAAGVAAWMATQLYFRHALATGFAAFVLAGFFVYPAAVLHGLFGVPAEFLVVAGGLLAGASAHWMVTRVDIS